MFKSDSEPLNRLAEAINANAHLLDEMTVRELQDVFNELESEYVLFENEVAFNEQLLAENEKLKAELRNKLEVL